MGRPARASAAILGFREVEVPAREVAFEVLVIELGQAADAMYALSQYLGSVAKEKVGSGAAMLLSEFVERRCDALQRLVEQRDGEGRADG